MAIQPVLILYTEKIDYSKDLLKIFDYSDCFTWYSLQQQFVMPYKVIPTTKNRLCDSIFYHKYKIDKIKIQFVKAIDALVCLNKWGLILNVWHISYYNTYILQVSI